MKTYDAVVVGAGPSGSSLAYQLKVRGLSVLLIDKAVFPRDKLCGGLCPDKTAKIYEKIYGRKFDCYDTICERVRIFNKGKRIVEATPSLPMYIVARRDFDAHLLGLYTDSGGEALTGTKVSRFNEESSTLLLSNGDTVCYKVLVGADGVNSVVRKLFHPYRRPNSFCIEGFGKRDPENALTVHFGALKNGYGWVFPQKECTVVGYGSFSVPPPEIVERFPVFSAGTGFPADNARGAYSPVNRLVKRPCRDNILLVGDAAGFVNPITGEGIYFSFLSAQYAAEAISDFLKGEKTLSEAYLTRIASMQKHIKKADTVKSIILAPCVMSLLCGKLAGNSEFFAYACDEMISKMPKSYFEILKKYSRKGIKSH